MIICFRTTIQEIRIPTPYIRVRILYLRGSQQRLFVITVIIRSVLPSSSLAKLDTCQRGYLVNLGNRIIVIQLSPQTIIPSIGMSHVQQRTPGKPVCQRAGTLVIPRGIIISIPCRIRVLVFIIPHLVIRLLVHERTVQGQTLHSRHGDIQPHSQGYRLFFSHVILIIQLVKIIVPPTLVAQRLSLLHENLVVPVIIYPVPVIVHQLVIRHQRENSQRSLHRGKP